jgi:hypothetical protein
MSEFGGLQHHVGAGRHGEDVILPAYIWMLHGNAVVHSVKDGTPGYTTDDRLRDLCAGHEELRPFAPRLDEMVAQLCRAEVWKREGDRYEMHAEQLLPLAILTYGKQTD